MKIKRFLSVLLSVCILCSLFVFSASAEEMEDYSIKILELPELVIGEVISDVTLSVPSDAKYTVTGKWAEVECGEYGDFSIYSEVSGTFEEGIKYALRLYVEASADWSGWNYADEDGWVYTDVMLGDEYLDSGWVYPTIDDDFYRYTISHNYLLGEAVSEVNVEGIPSAKVGEKATVDEIKISEDDKDVATVFNAKWYEFNIDTYERIEFTGTFEKGKLYELSVQIHAKDGYYFDETKVCLNGEEADNMGYTNYNIEVNSRLDLREKIEKVNILNVQEAKLGETATTEGIKAEDGAKYTVKSAKWIELYGESDDAFEGKFESKKKYDLEIELEAEEGYIFADEVDIYFDGAPADEDQADFSYMGYEECTISCEADFYEVLDVIEFTNSETKEVGNAPKEDAISAPEGANYEFDVITLLVPEDDEGGAEVATVYEDGKAYVTVIQFVVKDGYKAGDKTAVKINGETLNSSEYYFTTDIRGVAWADYVYFGKTPISELEFNIVPLPDKTPKDITAEIPSGANYTVESIEWYTTEGGIYEELADTDKFEKGKKYNFYAEVKAKDGYYITTDAKITLNGSDFYGFEDAYSNVFIYNEFSATVKSEVPVPATGDNMNLPLYVLAFVLSFGVLVVLKKKQTA